MRPRKDAASLYSRNNASICASATSAHWLPPSARSAPTRMSGGEIGDRQVRKGAPAAIQKHIEALGQVFPKSILTNVQEVARRGSTPLLVTDGTRVLGIMGLKDIVKGGIKERFGELS